MKRGDFVKILKNLLKGVVIGVATLVPGVSGGTMAIILGLYDDMIHAISSFFKNIKENIIFLFTVGFGAIIGIVAFSKMIDYSLKNFHFPMIFMFLGIILGGLPVLYNKANTKDKKKTDYIYFVIGFLVIAVMSFYTGTIVNLASAKGIWNILFLFVAGIIIAVALILPGISTSFMLLTLGLYDITLNAINNFELNYLIPIVLGAGFGVIATTKILEKFLNDRPRQTYLIILGFVMGSIIEVFPGIPTGLDIVYSIMMFVIGLVSIMYISKKYTD